MHGNCGLTIDFIEGLSGIAVFSVAAIKILLPWLHQERMRHIIQSSMEDWYNVRETRCRKIMNQYAFWGRLVYIIQISATFSVVLQMTLTRTPNFVGEASNNISFSRNMMLGPPCWIPLEMTSSFYFIHFYLITIALWGAIVAFSGCDSFIFNTALHICGQFEILTTSMDTFNGDVRYLKHRINKFSRRHDKLLFLGNQLNDTVNLIIGCGLLGNASLICISGKYFRSPLVNSSELGLI